MSDITDAKVETIAGHFYTMGSGIAWSQIDPHSSTALNYKRWAREALEAALLHLAPQPGTTEDLRDALEGLRENWSLEEIVKEAIREAEWCCEAGCGSGACESCPCCCAGYCVSGRDGLPNDDPEEVGRWLEIAADHNPAIAALRPLLLAAPHPRPVVDREALLSLLDSQQVGAAIPTNLLGAYRNTLADAVLALLNGGTAKAEPL